MHDVTRRFLVWLLMPICLAGCAWSRLVPVPAGKWIEVKPAILGQYIVVLADNTPAADLPRVAHEMARQAGGTVALVYAAESSLRGFALRGTALWRARALASDPRVKYVEQDAQVFSTGTRTNPGWALDRIDQRGAALDNRFQSSTDGDGVTVFVVDTGIDGTHPEFSGNVQFGYDMSPANGGVPCDSHGTAMASLIGGRTLGVAPRATLVNVKTSNCAIVASSNLIGGVDWVTAHARAPAVVNISQQLTLGSTSLALRTAIANLVAKDVIVVVAAGNDNDDVAGVEPANYPGVTTVAASMISGDRWVNPGSPTTGCGALSGCGSNFGAQVALFAPGAGIRTAWWTPSGPIGQYSTAPPGTSAAAAIVSGAAAAHLQALWVPMRPGVTYLRTPSEEARLTLLANSTRGALSDVRSGPNQLLFDESWPVSVGRTEVPGAALNAAAASPSSAGVPRLYAAAGFDRRFAENAPSGAVPFAAQSFDQNVPSWAAAVALPNGACADVHDANIAHAWIACTRVVGGRQQGFVRAIDRSDGSTVGEVDVGRTAAACSGSAQPQSIARAVRSNRTTGAIYVVGEAWCGSGPRHAFLAHLDTPAATVAWEQRIFGATDLESAAYGLVVRQQPNAMIVVTGHRTAASDNVRRARVEQFLDQGVSIGAVSIGPVYGDASAFPSAAFGVALDMTGGVFVTGQRDGPGAPFAVVQRLDATLSVAWEQTLPSARIQGLVALKGGLLVAGHSDRVLPTWPNLPPPPPQLPPGMPLGEWHAFLMRLDPDGSLRWTRLVEGHRVEALGLQGELELDGTAIAHVVGGRDSQPCTVVPPGCPVFGFVESFRVK